MKKFNYNPIYKLGFNQSPFEFDTVIVIKTVQDLLNIHPPNLSNEIELGNNVYLIDSTNLDLGIYTLVSNTNTAIHGNSQLINKISSSEDNISLITSTGNLFLFQIELGATGLNSQVINMEGATGIESLDMKYVAFSSGSKYGTLKDIRQGYWSDGFSMNAREGFTLDSTSGQSWSGGFTLFNSRIINTGNFILQGTSDLRIQNIRSNVNASIDTGAVAFDFEFDNIVNDQGFQIENARFDGTGLMAATFTNGDSLEIEKSRKSFFQGNEGNLAKNSLIGGLWECDSEVTTTLTQNTLTKIAGDTVYTNLQHIVGDNNNEFKQADTNEISYNLDGEITLDATQNNEIKLSVRKFINSSSTYIDLKETTKTVVNSVGGDDIVIFRPFVPVLNLLENDRVELWVTNLSDNNDVTMKLTSFLYLNKL